MREARGEAEVPRALQVVSGYSWRLLVVVLAALALALALVELRLIVLPVIAALLLTTLLSPLVERLKARGWRPALATTAVFVGVTLLFAGFIGSLVPQVLDDAGEMGEAVRGGADQALEYLAGAPFNLSRERIDEFVESAADQLSRNRDRIASGVLSGALLVGEFITTAILTAFLLFFFLKDGKAMWGWFVGQFRQPASTHLRQIGTRVWATMGGYLRGVATVGLVEATAIGIVLAVLGVPLLAPLVVLQFLAAFFPVVGALVAGTVAALVALVSGGIGDALVVAIAILVIQQADNHLLQPLIMGRAVNLHPVVVILALTAGGILGGILGALLAVPLTAVGATVGGYLNELRSHDSPSFAELQRGPEGQEDSA